MWYCEHITPIWRQRELYDLSGESFEWTHCTMTSAMAAEMVNKIILSVNGPTRLPQYYFDYDNVMQLTHKGLALDSVKQFMGCYDEAVKAKLRDPSLVETEYGQLERIIDAVHGSHRLQPSTAAGALNEASAAFEFLP
jgi:hypothetical protein